MVTPGMVNLGMVGRRMVRRDGGSVHRYQFTIHRALRIDSFFGEPQAQRTRQSRFSLPNRFVSA